MENKKIATILFILPLSAVIALLPAGCDGGNASKSNAGAASAASPQKKYNAIPDRVVGLARIEPEGKTVQIYPQVSGVVKEVKVKLSDQVKKGQLLFVIDHQTQDAQIQVSEAQIGEQESIIKSADSNLEKGRINAEQAEKNYQRIRKVYEQGADTKANLDNTESAWKTALEDVNTLNQSLENAKARLSELQANKRLLQIEKDKYFIKAPADGVILQVDGVLGSVASPSVSLVDFAAESPTDALVEIDELFAGLVQINQPAFVRKQSSDDTLAVGRVVEVAPALRQKSLFSDEIGKLEDRRVREVRVRITEGQANVLYGQRVECVIQVKTDK